jgi:hypothetical protein
MQLPLSPPELVDVPRHDLTALLGDRRDPSNSLLAPPRWLNLSPTPTAGEGAATMGAMSALVVLLVLGAIGLVVYLVTRSGDRAMSQRERAELNRLRVLVDDLKETAWEHRELDSALSTIMIDKIREYERRNRELGP